MLMKSWLRRVVLFYDSVTSLASASCSIPLDQGFSNCGSERRIGSRKKILGLRNKLFVCALCHETFNVAKLFEKIMAIAHVTC